MKRLKSESTETVVVGIDQSSDGTACVALSNGTYLDQMFYAKSKKQANEYRKRGALDKFSVGGRDEVGRVIRLSTIENDVRKFIRKHAASYAALELHYFSGGAGVRTIAEVSGVLKVSIVRQGVKLRGYEVDSIKIFATGKGKAEKADVMLAVREKWGADYIPLGTKNTDPGSNLGDAYTIARMLYVELELRAGRIDLKDLAEEERRVFLRTTPLTPVNLLDTPFVEL